MLLYFLQSISPVVAGILKLLNKHKNNTYRKSYWLIECQLTLYKMKETMFNGKTKKEGQNNQHSTVVATSLVILQSWKSPNSLLL
jgi:hypothetical protein